MTRRSRWCIPNHVPFAARVSNRGLMELLVQNAGNQHRCLHQQTRCAGSVGLSVAPGLMTSGNVLCDAANAMTMHLRQREPVDCMRERSAHQSCSLRGNLTSPRGSQDSYLLPAGASR